MARSSRDRPIIVQSDRSVLVEVNNPNFEAARDYLSLFAELVKSPEYIHTYRITPISLWNAAASGLTPENILQFLKRYAKYETPQNVQRDIHDYMSRYGRLVLKKRGDDLVLVSDDPSLITEILHTQRVARFVSGRLDDVTVVVPPVHRGDIKQAMARIGYPVKDVAGYVDGTFFDLLKCETLIICTNIVAIRQWMSELLDKTNILRSDMGEYSGEKKGIKPITITTYQMLTHRASKDSDYKHFRIFSEKNWGLIIYDEVHLLPAPVFRITASLQAKRRLGLTATLVREDGLETDVFSLIGPKRFDIPWKELESKGWIAEAYCSEIRVDLPTDVRRSYALAEPHQRYRLAAENPRKVGLVRRLVSEYQGEQILIIGQYIRQLQEIAETLGAPFIRGATPTVEREMLYEDFRRGKIKVLVVSKVANFAVDLPEASVAIQVSGTFGNRQLYLTEQGYAYSIYDWTEIVGG